MIPFIVLVAAIGVGLFLIHGQKISHSSINEQVRDTIQSVVGDDYEVALEGSEISLISSASVGLSGNGVSIRKKSSDIIVAKIETIKVGLDIASLFRGEFKFDNLIAENGEINFAELFQTPITISQPENESSTTAALRSLGEALLKVEQPFQNNSIEKIELFNIQILRDKVASEGSLIIQEAQIFNSIDVERPENDRIVLKTKVLSENSKFDLTADWRDSPDGGKQLALGIGPLNSREWFATPLTGELATSAVGLQTMIRADLKIPFDNQMAPQQPFMKVQLEPGLLRIGKNTNSPLQYGVFNFRIFPERDQIELERSQVVLGNTEFQLVGGVRPVLKEDSKIPASFLGPLEIELIAESIDPTIKIENIEPIPGQAKIHFFWMPEEKTFRIDAFQLDAAAQTLAGTGEVVLGDTSPAVVVNLSSKELNVAAVKQFWPLFIAPKASDWIEKNVDDGKFTSLKIDIDIPQGRLTRVVDPSLFKPEEIAIAADFDNAVVRTFGELPDISAASGKFLLSGTTLTTSKVAGTFKQSGDDVSVKDSSLEIDGVGTPDALGKLDLNVFGSIAAIAKLADSKPFLVAKSMAMKPEGLDGKAEASIAAEFPVHKKVDKTKAKWTADLKLTNASSKSPILGRSIDAADLAITATPTQVTANGTANIDGYKTEISLIEPINGASEALRKRSVKTALSDAELAKNGIAVSPVITGKMTVEIEADAKGEDVYTVDLTNTEISLPWLSWLKGPGIAAKAEFKLRQKTGSTQVEDFKLSSKSFGANGKFGFEKGKLVYANIQDIVLSDNSNFNLNIKATKGGFAIDATGRSFDGRALINKIIHTDGVDGVMSKTSIDLNANFGKLVGFNNRAMENVVVDFSSRNGLINNLKIRGVFDDGLSTITAKRNGDITSFDFSASDAGASMAMVRLYDKMRGGKLSASLNRTGNGPFIGNVKIRDFTVEGEPRLSSLVAAKPSDRQLVSVSGQLQQINVQKVRFKEMTGAIKKGNKSLSIENGVIRNSDIGLTFEGNVYDADNQMNMRGTFMPLFGVSRAIGTIPIIGQIFSNGKDQALIGITYQLKGAANKPNIAVNPISLMAPGIFRKIFEFRE